jgi:hypothetical protein
MIVAHHGGPNDSQPPPTPPPDGNPPSATYAGHPNDDAKPLIEIQVRIDINRPSTDTTSFPMRALLLNLFKELQKVHSVHAILPIDASSNSPTIRQATDFPVDDTITQYFGGFQDAPGRTNQTTKTLRVFVRIQSDRSLRDLKFNAAFYAWLKTNNLFLSTHGFSKSFDVASAGFIAMMHPNLHRRDQVNSLIQNAIKDTDVDYEIQLVPHRLPIGKGADRTYTTVVEIRADKQHLHRTREILIEIFETYSDHMPKEFYFVPTPTNGSMTYETYHQHLQLHQHHVSSLRSFALSNIRQIRADITVYDPDGSNPRTMALEDALLSQKSPNSNRLLFSSVEPTQTSGIDGRYLLITDKDLLPDAEAFIDSALQSLNAHPGNLANASRDSSPITRANRIASSNRFQSYTTKLKNMIPAIIHTDRSLSNAWKRRTPTLLNLSEDAFPPLSDPSKKPRTGTTHPATDSDTTHTDTTNSLTAFELEAHAKAQQAVTDALTQQIELIRQETADLQRTMQDKFQDSLNAMSNLELRLEQRVQTAISSLSLSINAAVDSMHAQSARYDDRLSQFLASFQNQADRMTTQVDRMFHTQPPDLPPHADHRLTTPPSSPDHPTSRQRTLPNHIDDRPFVPTVWDMDHTDPPADGSLQSSASHATPPNKGTDASTGGHK